jgi:hypothetical protein
MRRCMAVLIALGCAALSGCLADDKGRTTVRSHSPPMPGVVGEDVVYLDFAVVERTLGDTFLTRELWSEADEEVVRVEDEPAASLERKKVLENNGFHVGQVGGMVPTKLQDALDAQKGCEKRQIQLHAGHETILACGSPWPHCRCRLVRGETLSPTEFDKAQCELMVVPTLADEGRVRLRFTPRVKHGEVQQTFLSVCEADGQRHWDRQEHASEEIYPWLSWTLTVAPDEYIVLGALLDRGETLGEHFFLTREEDRPIVQRLLVLRAVHVPTPINPLETSFGPCPPLALRAGMIAARGTSE